MKNNLIALASISILQACSPSHMTHSSLSQNDKAEIASQSQPVQSADNLMAAANQTCANMVSDLGADHLKNLTLNIEYTSTGMKFRFHGRNHSRTEPTYSVQFNPSVFGFSIKLRNSAGVLAIPTTTFTVDPRLMTSSEFSFAGFISQGSQRSARIDFHLGRMREIDNLVSANVELYCNNTLVGTTGNTFFPNPTHVDACKNDGGKVVNGECHFGEFSCIRKDLASTKLHYARLNGYTTCFGVEPKIHADCAKGYPNGDPNDNEVGHYVASCPLINAQEVAARRVTETKHSVEILYRDLRGRNPDRPGRNYWVQAIDIDKSATLQDLESALRQP